MFFFLIIPRVYKQTWANDHLQITTTCLQRLLFYVLFSTFRLQRNLWKTTTCQQRPQLWGLEGGRCAQIYIWHISTTTHRFSFNISALFPIKNVYPSVKMLKNFVPSFMDDPQRESWNDDEMWSNSIHQMISQLNSSVDFISQKRIKVRTTDWKMIILADMTFRRMNDNLLQCPPLNRITSGRHKSDNNNRMIQ